MQTHPLKYLQLLSEKYPSIQAASTAIINFSALLQLPKGTEHFLSDIHGEHEAFQHVVRNGAGSILRKIDEMFSNSMSKSERRNLATLIYYPELKSLLRSIKAIGAQNVGEGGRNGMMGRRAWQKVEAAYEQFRTPAGLPASYDVLLGYATK